MSFISEYFKHPAVKIGLLAGLISVLTMYTHEYGVSKAREVVVLDKMESSGGRRSSGYYYLILREDRGIVFDLIVSPATYSQTKIGDKKLFNLRQMDIKQTFYDNFVQFVFLVLCGSASMSILLVMFVGLLIERSIAKEKKSASKESECNQ